MAAQVDNYSPGQKRAEGWILYAKEITKSTYDFWNGIASIQVVGTEGQNQRHGLWTWWHKNGQKQMEGRYEADLPIGKFTWWYPNGQKQLQGEYIAGKQQGKFTWWHPSGQKQLEGAYVAGVLTGKWTRWNAEGHVVEVGDYTADGKQLASEPKPLPSVDEAVREARGHRTLDGLQSEFGFLAVEAVTAAEYRRVKFDQKRSVKSPGTAVPGLFLLALLFAAAATISRSKLAGRPTASGFGRAGFGCPFGNSPEGVARPAKSVGNRKMFAMGECRLLINVASCLVALRCAPQPNPQKSSVICRNSLRHSGVKWFTGKSVERSVAGCKLAASRIVDQCGWKLRWDRCYKCSILFAWSLRTVC